MHRHAGRPGVPCGRHGVVAGAGGRRRRSLALREYAFGLEALHRFVAGEPLWRVDEAVAAVLACESEPVDPRL
ncbi:hypothetical protein ACTXG6_05660 [Pseudonocardia sp. Cha107L01]|uniref:hypothetical protein n=1 Tax=Pseudonocardia sp. Cha107L01 TaxID=3457576 RepID=UPI00403EB17D